MLPRKGNISLAILVITLLLLVGYTTAQAAGSTNASTENPGPAVAAQPLVLTDDQQQYQLGMHLDILEDPTGNLTIEDVTSPAYASQFLPSQVAVPNYGYTSSAYWVRFTLDNQTTGTSAWLLEQAFANTHHITLYTPKTDGQGYIEKESGSILPVSTRDVLYPNIVFNLSVPVNSQQTNYVRFQSQASMTINLRLWTASAFINTSGRDLILHWLIFGGLIALLAFHGFLMLSLREWIYLYFFIMIASILAMLLIYTGYFGIYILPGLNLYNEEIFPLTVSAMYFSMILFSDIFLELKTRFPIFHKTNIAFLVWWGILALLTPFISYHNIAIFMAPTMLVTSGITFVIGMTVWRSSTIRTRFFMLAWVSTAFSLVLVMLIRVTLIPSTNFSEILFQLGFLVMAVSWSLALADRINLLKFASDKASRDLRNSEQKLNQILEGLPLGVIVYGKDQKPTYMNRRSAQILTDPTTGNAPDPAADNTIAQVIDQFSVKAAGTGQSYLLEDLPLYKALQGEPSFADDIELQRGTNSLPLEMWANPIRDDQGNIEAAVAAFQDITEQKQVDAELADYRQNLEQIVKERTVELNLVNEQLQLRVKWLLAENEIRQSIAGEADLPQAFEKLLLAIYNILKAKVVFIVRWDEQDEQYQMYCHSAEEHILPGLEKLRPVFLPGTPLREQINEGKLIILSAEEAASLPGPLRVCSNDINFNSMIISPLMIHQVSGGILGIASADTREHIVSLQVELIERIAYDLAGLAEEASMLDQKRLLVALEERNRLARDLHDSVTQTLFTATLLTEVMPQVWRRNPEHGLQMLDKLRRLTRGALAEMRTMLIELRPSAVLNTPLSELLSQLTEAVTNRSDLPFQIFIEKIDILPDEVQMNFYRVAQEALNNVVKHSQAMHVIVTLSEIPLNNEPGNTSTLIKLVIQDDGVGFATGSEKLGRLGIGIMRERAAAIDADLSITSEPGHGTQVTLTWKNVPPVGDKL